MACPDKSGRHQLAHPALCLRYAFVTEAIAAGIDAGTVAQLMGYDPKMLLDHYQHVVDKRKRAAVEALPEISDYGRKIRRHKVQG